MRALWYMSQNTFREAKHNKVIYIAGFFAAAIIVFSFFMGEVSLYQNEKVVKDVGLAAISLFGLFVAIYLGVTTLHRELEKRTIYTLVSKPLSRAQILLGRYFGMLFVLFVVVLIMFLYLELVIIVMLNGTVTTGLLPAIFLIYVELSIVAAMATLFSSFSTPFLSGFFTFGFYLVGQITSELGQFGERSENPFFKWIATTIQKIYDLEAFDLTTRVAHGLPVYAQDVWIPFANAICMIGVLLIVSIYFFNRRDFK